MHWAHSGQLFRPNCPQPLALPKCYPRLPCPKGAHIALCPHCAKGRLYWTHFSLMVKVTHTQDESDSYSFQKLSC